MFRISSGRIQLAVLSAAVLLACRPNEAATGSEKEAGAESVEAAPEPRQEAGLVLTPEQVKVAGIATAAAEERSEAAPIRTTATIEPASDRHARIGSRIAGRIQALRVRVGDRVRIGQVLAIVDSPELGQARADYLAAVAAARVARETADREKALFERKISAEREWREAEAAAIKARTERQAAENRLHALGVTDRELPKLDGDGHLGSTMAITTPVEGLVVEAAPTLGQLVDPEQTLFVVMDLRMVWIQADVYEQDLAHVSVGQKATVVSKAAPDVRFAGTIDNVGAVVDPTSRTVKVRIVLDNRAGVLKPGMFATVEIEGTSGEQRRGLFVPSAALQRLGSGHVVFVARSETSFEPRRVQVVRSGEDWTEIGRGLDAGERVVTTGAFALKSELSKDELGGEE